MPMTPEKKAALDKYLSGGKSMPMDDAKSKPTVEVEVGMEGEGEEGDYGDYEGPESYRVGDESDGELEVYSGDEMDPAMRETTDREPEQVSAQERGKRVGMRTRPALQDAYKSAMSSRGGM